MLLLECTLVLKGPVRSVTSSFVFLDRLSATDLWFWKKYHANLPHLPLLFTPNLPQKQRKALEDLRYSSNLASSTITVLRFLPVGWFFHYLAQGLIILDTTRQQFAKSGQCRGEGAHPVTQEMLWRFCVCCNKVKQHAFISLQWLSERGKRHPVDSSD